MEYRCQPFISVRYLVGLHAKLPSKALSCKRGFLPDMHEFLSHCGMAEQQFSNALLPTKRGISDGPPACDGGSKRASKA